MYDKCYFCLDQLPKLKKESTASFFVNFGGAGVQKSRPTLLYSCEMMCKEPNWEKLEFAPWEIGLHSTDDLVPTHLQLMRMQR